MSYKHFWLYSTQLGREGRYRHRNRTAGVNSEVYSTQSAHAFAFITSALSSFIALFWVLTWFIPNSQFINSAIFTWSCGIMCEVSRKKEKKKRQKD